MPTSLSTLPWIDVLKGAANAATILGIVLGGVAAYYRFLRGRVFYPRLEVTITSAMFSADDYEFLKVNAIIKNTGSSRMVFIQQQSVLRIFGARHEKRHIVDLTTWELLASLEFTAQHKWIEAAETIQMNWLIDIPQDIGYAVTKAELCVAGKRSLWLADAITERAAAEAP